MKKCSETNLLKLIFLKFLHLGAQNPTYGILYENEQQICKPNTTFCMKEADKNATYILKQLLKGGEGEKFFVGGQIENMELSNF